MQKEQAGEIKTKGEAIQFAIDWQSWVSGESLGWGDLLDWQKVFEDLAGRFGLIEEFKENGII